MDTTLLSISTLATLVPAFLQTFRPVPARDRVFWATLALAFFGPLGWVLSRFNDAWQTGLASSLWLTVAVTTAIYAITVAVQKHAWRLASLLMPYLMVLGIVASVWQGATGQTMVLKPAESAWAFVHIGISLITYALITIAATAALAALIKEKTLKTKHRGRLSARLPSVSETDVLMIVLLRAATAVLCIGLITGMALQYMETGSLFVLNHKTVLVAAAFLTLIFLLVSQYGKGVRGKTAARIVMLAYLLITLGYPGVKFVTDVLMG